MLHRAWRVGFIAFVGLILLSAVPRSSQGQSTREARERKVLTDARWLWNNLNAFWTAELARLYNIRFDPVRRLEFARGNDRVYCGARGDPIAKNAIYCFVNSDEKVVFDIDWFQSYLVNFPGGATTFLVLAHEWGHAVQDTWLETNPQTGKRDTWTKPYFQELQADCLAGVFLSWAYKYGDLKQDVDDQAALKFWLNTAESGPWLDHKTHGTSADRTSAFSIGTTETTEDCRCRY